VFKVLFLLNVFFRRRSSSSFPGRRSSGGDDDDGRKEKGLYDADAVACSCCMQERAGVRLFRWMSLVFFFSADDEDCVSNRMRTLNTSLSSSPSLLYSTLYRYSTVSLSSLLYTGKGSLLYSTAQNFLRVEPASPVTEDNQNPFTVYLHTRNGTHSHE